ncbi:MAG TPA: RT0821/Lpp0805 family surface protein [Patescibacteria group bacterium]|nr:RT0821/Lpp0805 family surface protein [Patescibacteria group bacterium]
MKKQLTILALMATLSLGACAQPGEQNAWGMGNKQTVGALGGAVAGGLLGSKIGKGSGASWATGAGAVLGALAGSSIGKSLDQADRMYAQQAWDRAYTAPIGQTVRWNNPDNGHYGTVTPVREGRSTSTGSTCREYKQSIFIDGQAQTAVGTACQNSDGSWAIVN